MIETINNRQVFYHIGVMREGDDAPLSWWFEDVAEYKQAMDHIFKANAKFQSPYSQHARPEGEMIHDAEELRIWLHFEYLVDDSAEPDEAVEPGDPVQPGDFDHEGDSRNP